MEALSPQLDRSDVDQAQPQVVGGHMPTSPPWLSHPDPTVLPLKRDRVTKLVAYLRDAGQAAAAQAQVLYGRETFRGGSIEWESEPFHPEVPEPLDKGAGYVVCKVSEGTKLPWKVHSIVVQDPNIMRVLRTALAEYPGLSPALDTLTLRSPFQPMLHRWTEFRRAVDAADQPTQNLMVGFVDVLQTELGSSFRVLHDADQHRVISHEHLWVLFPPGELIWWNLKREHHCVGKVLETWFSCQDGQFCIEYEQIVWDGHSLRPAAETLRIPSFTGTRPISELNAVPLRRKTEEQKIRRIVLERGSRFLDLTGVRYKQYLGLGLTQSRLPGSGPRWEAVSGRIVLDAALWDGKVADRQQSPLKSRGLDDDERLICSPLMKGYCLTSKQWYHLFVANVSDIVWADSFSHLVLGQVEKSLLLGFAKTKLRQTACAFDDFVPGKGKGVIILLSGPPGVGKTLTVESIADKMRAPLYPLSAGELGISPDRVEPRLRQALTFCKEWDGILLLDEADIFMESRTVSDLERNELVSIFLRLLEYYDGMMFLTTNRADSIDAAFQSRIDLTIRYQDLTPGARRAIWADFVQRSADGHLVESTDYDHLSSYALNGRQIKNAVKLARMLAMEEGELLRGRHLQSIVNMSGPVHE